MASTAITPTRMVLNQLKGRLKTARRGHKLLKDKRDELMRQFLDIVRLNQQLRTKVEQGLTEAFGSLSVASAIMSPEMLEQSLLYPRQSVELGMKYKNIMSVNVPVYDFKTKNDDPSEIFPYGFAQTSGELDDALEQLANVFKDMLELAQIEKSMQLLAQEIEKTRRRVNALEYVMIPELEENIRSIEEINVKIRANLDKAKAEEDAQACRDQYDGLTRELESVRAQRQDLLKGAKLPLEGLSVDDGRLTYFGKNWDSMSGSDQLKAATAIVRAVNPKCGFVLLDKLEQMDLDTLRDFGVWLEQEGLQVIATRVSTGDECSIIIEDGAALAPAVKAPPAPPAWNGGKA